MGVVYLGIRDDEQFVKRVAIKLCAVDSICNPWSIDSAMNARFWRRPDHPYVAKLLDEAPPPMNAVLHNGYVEGTPITDYAGHNFTVR